MKIDRLLGIITTLLQQDKITAPELAKKFEVSRRTILRDIDDICKAGIPIITYQGGAGGISIAEGYKLDKNVLTTDELHSIIAGLRSIGSVSDSVQIEGLISKLSPKSKTNHHCGQCGDLPCEKLYYFSYLDKEHGDNPPGARIELLKNWREVELKNDTSE